MCSTLTYTPSITCIVIMSRSDHMTQKQKFSVAKITEYSIVTDIFKCYNLVSPIKIFFLTSMTKLNNTFKSNKPRGLSSEPTDVFPFFLLTSCSGHNIICISTKIKWRFRRRKNIMPVTKVGRKHTILDSVDYCWI